MLASGSHSDRRHEPRSVAYAVSEWQDRVSRIACEGYPRLSRDGGWHIMPRVTGGRGSRLVYSSDTGRTCPTCGWPIGNCQCSTQRQVDEPIPTRVTAKLRMEKKGRGGKTMTVIDGLPRNAAFLKDLCQDLKRLCGTGGAIADGTVELQGDLRDRLRPHLVAKGFLVKG